VGSLSTAGGLESTLPLSDPVTFPVQGIQQLLWLVHSAFSRLTFLGEVNHKKALVTCVYAYEAVHTRTASNLRFSLKFVRT
jgi:hypothetical protein